MYIKIDIFMSEKYFIYNNLIDKLYLIFTKHVTVNYSFLGVNKYVFII